MGLMLFIGVALAVVIILCIDRQITKWERSEAQVEEERARLRDLIRRSASRR